MYAKQSQPAPPRSPPAPSDGLELQITPAGITCRIVSRVPALPLTDDPLTVFHDTTEDMDANEVATLYGILDKNGDEQVTVDRFLFDPSTHPAVHL